MEESDKKICQKCGYANPSSAKFCNNCGSKLVVLTDKKIEGSILQLTFMVTIVSFLDVIFNYGIYLAVSVSSILTLIRLIWFISCILVITVWYKGRNLGVYVGTRWYKIFFFSVVSIFLSYLIYFILFLIIGRLPISPLWIFYGYLMYHLHKFGRS